MGGQGERLAAPPIATFKLSVTRGKRSSSASPSLSRTHTHTQQARTGRRTASAGSPVGGRRPRIGSPWNVNDRAVVA